ncbi:MAG: hypothetical protein K6V73_05515 [Firmicutes bacterium]|nr:hypothetical protein [Bacillota bacterium]
MGLWRTEWMGAGTPPPSEEELTVAFTAVARLFGPEAVTVRLPDPGGGEAVDGASGSGPNPALGRRGVRAALARPESVRPFVRALLRAAAGAPNLRLLVPMVGMAAELRGVRAELAGQAALLAAQGVAVRPPVLGAMLEVPAAVLSVARLAAAADFFSLGTNDLGQYTLAADRGAAATAYLLDGMHPAVLRLVATAVAAAGRARREIGVCGEAAGEPWAIPLLIGVGVRSLSVAPPRVASVRALLARIDPKAAQALARAALRLEDGGAVRRRAEAFLARL